MNELVARIRNSKSIILSTHRECDGDGVGAQLAMFYALKKLGKEVRVLNVDHFPSKYRYLDPKNEVESFEGPHKPLQKTDLALIFDTNDERFLQPLFSEFKKYCRQINFIDHHPILENGPHPTRGSYIDTAAASTGEIVYDVVKELGVPLDPMIARALYTSIVFDTQLFRFIRKSSSSHVIAAELLKFENDPEEVHRRLFGNQTISKIAFLARALSKVEYFAEGKLALLRIQDADLSEFGLDVESSRDVIDFVMNIESIEIAVMLREDRPQNFKVSLRSKGRIEVSSVAESIGGGGHFFSAGAFFKGSYEVVKKQVVDALLKKLAA